MKTSELTGAALDWAVAKCEGIDPETLNTKTGVVYSLRYGLYRPSTDWAQGGPIIERERITVHDLDGLWIAVRFERTSFGVPLQREPAGKGVFGRYVVLQHEFGISPLEAAMRCYVAYKLGDEVDVPEELE